MWGRIQGDYLWFLSNTSSGPSDLCNELNSFHVPIVLSLVLYGPRDRKQAELDLQNARRKETREMARDLESQLAAVERIAQVWGVVLAERPTGNLLASQQELSPLIACTRPETRTNVQPAVPRFVMSQWMRHPCMLPVV